MRWSLPAILLAALVLLSAGSGAEAQTFIGGTNVWTMVGTPQVMTAGLYTGLSVTYHNNLNVPVSADVFMVLHNSLGQTVYYTADYLMINASSTAPQPVFLVAGGVGNGMYSASVFAVVSSSGVAITNSSVGTYSL